MFILYSHHLLIFIDFQNNKVIKERKLFKKENMSCTPRCVFFLCEVHFQAADDTAMAAMSLLTGHVMKTFLHYLIKCFNKKLLLNKCYHFLRSIFILRYLITELLATLILNFKYRKNII